MLLQTRITTYAAIGFMAAGFPFGGFTQNYRIGAMCVVLGGVLLASSRIIATVHDWAYTVLFITAGLTVLVVPLAMWWAYRVGVGKPI